MNKIQVLIPCLTLAAICKHVFSILSLKHQRLTYPRGIFFFAAFRPLDAKQNKQGVKGKPRGMERGAG